MPRSTRTRRRVPDRTHGLLDTSAVIGLPRLDPGSLPERMSVSAITLAELAAGPHATDDRAERALRQDRLQRAEAAFDPLPFDAAAARAYGRLYASVLSARRKARGRRALDLLIAAVAVANQLPLFACNSDDFAQLEGLDVVAVAER